MSNNTIKKLWSGPVQYKQSVEEIDNFSKLDDHIVNIFEDVYELMQNIPNIDDYVGVNNNKFTQKLMLQGINEKDAKEISFTSMIHLIAMNMC
jgi:hypothetical protein